jgi:hypothetical protein
MKFEVDKIRVNVRQSSTEDLMDRATVFRQGMEEQAIALIEAELHERGVAPEAIAAHGRAKGEACLWGADGIALQCSFCRNPAVAQKWGWQRLWGVLPVFPRRFRYCSEHLNASALAIRL